MLISETHFTNKNVLKIHGYKLYHTQHLSGRAHRSSAIIIKSTETLPSFESDYLQATNVAIEDWHNPSSYTACSILFP
ncbi:hypothetical protein QLX08_009326 [Tetragonisca angustula]|uniref:Uncharacterized protein n=1 Tax=Tetragonisca angustula TaxID=166442 RepID=A0AAW0ZI49_9HYME